MAKARTPMKETPEDAAERDRVYQATGDELRQFIERYEQIEAEKKDASARQKDLMAEAKARGFHTPTMKRVIAIRKKNPDDHQHDTAMLDTYLATLGMA